MRKYKKMVELQKDGLDDTVQDMHIAFKFNETEKYILELIGKKSEIEIVVVLKIKK